jgi:outer membrane protein OmpA-like peptidoglycan-associated protein
MRNRRTFSAWTVVATLVLAPLAAHAQTDEQLERIRRWNPQVKEFQKPGDIQQPTRELQVPRGIQAVRVETERCERRLQVGADALFAFDAWTLGPDAEETLVVLLPELEKAGARPVSVEGHTDAKGSDAYNATLSEKRASTVKQWLVARGAVPDGTKVVAYGESRPIAPNEKPDGTDDPEGRQRNRRVEVVIDTCG